jgi:ribosome-interacting GTPase 1
MVNYNNGKIYKITALNAPEEEKVYIGSTTKNRLCERMAKHRIDYKQWKEGKCTKVMSFELFDKYGIENCQIVLLELVNANSKDELLMRERYYIQAMNCYNKISPIQTEEERKLYEKEYRDNHKKETKKYKAEYQIKNREKLCQTKMEYYALNKDEMNEKARERYKLNRDVKLAKANQSFDCECGGSYCYGTKSRHFKTLMHSQFINPK